MYSRGIRKLTQESSTTKPELGPGSYNPKSYSKRADGYAPFSSLTPRETFSEVTNENALAPGPGYYESSKADVVLNANVKGTKFGANGKPRFSHTFSEVPGPGTYDLSQEKDWIKHQARQVPDPNEYINGAGFKGNAKKSVCWVRTSGPPSIPANHQVYGYEEEEDGSLIQQKAPERDATLGPAYYQFKTKEATWIQEGKGSNFCNSKMKRHEFKPKDGPGPGSYDPSDGSYHGPARPLPCFQSKQKRYHEIISAEEDRKAVPGPDSYSLPSSVQVGHKPVQFQYFNSTSKRLAGADPDHPNAPEFTRNPGPGSYNDPRTSFHNPGQQAVLDMYYSNNPKFTKKTKPFASSASRFKKTPRKSDIPGPGSYNEAVCSSFTNELSRKIISRKGIFGSTASRFQQKRSERVPGPGHYDQDNRMSWAKKSAVFSSTTNRPSLSKKDAVPPPGAYNTDLSFKKSQEKKSVPSAFAKKTIPFCTSTQRKVFDSEPAIKEAKALPGPGAYYNGNSTLSKKGPVLRGKEGRFASASSSNPGPGSYDISPLYQDSTVRRTFNVTFDNCAYAW
eukprot:Nk52_evm92s224 gene=Nk52_evmTU92s224